MSGFELLDQLQDDQALRDIPVVFMGKELTSEEEARLYIAKPVNTEQLLSLLRVWLYR